MQAFGKSNGLAYGLLGLPLAFVALPLYVILPNYYAKEFGVPLAILGAILLGARLFDAFIDPLLGKLSDHLFKRSSGAILQAGLLAALVLAAGFALLFFPQVTAPNALIVWVTIMLMVTYAAYSFLSVSHQSWGAMLGGNEAERSRIVAWREALGLVGVVMASVTPVALGMPATTTVFFVALGIGWLAWTRAVQPVAKKDGPLAPGAIWLPFRHSNFKRLLLVFMLNGTASAVPATLVLFFIQDRLQAPSRMEPAFLGGYFLAAALSIPLWLAIVKRIGLAKSWLLGMALSIAVFIWATQIGSGQITAFLVICILSGVALGTDLALPGAMLAGVIQNNGDSGKSEGAYFGWWNFAIKLNLALAAGLALPLLGVFGYAPGVRSPEALSALIIAYCVLPCVLKLAASACLYFFIIQPSSKPVGINP
jgi:GPH family glycoside/pentoside/hexuronide:cation symporter